MTKTEPSYRTGSTRRGESPGPGLRPLAKAEFSTPPGGMIIALGENPGFHNLIERGIRWSCNDDLSKVNDYLQEKPFPTPEMNAPRTDVTPFEYLEVGK